MAGSHKSGRCHAVHILLAFHVVPEFVSIFHALLVYLSVCASNQAFYDLYDFYDLCDQYGAGHRGDNTAQDWGDDTMGVGGGANGSMNSGGVDKRVSLELGLILSLAVEGSEDGGESGVGSSVDSREDMGDGNMGTRGGHVDSRSGNVDSTVADGTNTRDDTVAVVDSSDDSNGVGIRISLSPGSSHKQNLRMGMGEDIRRKLNDQHIQGGRLLKVIGQYLLKNIG